MEKEIQLNNYNYLSKKKEKELFLLFKKTKQIYFNKIEYPKSELELCSFNDCYVEDITNNIRKIEYVSYFDEKKRSIIGEGFLSSYHQVKSIIVDVDVINSRFLDESCLEVLFISDKVKEITNNFLLSPKSLVYIYVDSKNNNYLSYENVLINKLTKEIICYPNGKKNDIYYVPNLVKIINNNVFADNIYLKEIYVSKETKISKNIDFGNIKIFRY